MLRIFFIFLSILFFGWNASAQYFSSFPESFSFRRKNQTSVYLSTSYSVYSDVQIQSGPAQELDPTVDIEMGFRLGGIFNFILAGSQSLKNSESTAERLAYGLGLRIDLPGFFLIGARQSDFYKEIKNYPLNTSIYILAMSHDSKDLSHQTMSRSVISRYGLGLEIFPWQKLVYINLDASLFILQGNAFFSYGGGLGFQF